MAPKAKPTMLTVNDAVAVIRQAKSEGNLPLNFLMDQSLAPKLNNALRSRGVLGVHLSKDPDPDKGLWAYIPEKPGYR